MSKQLSNDELVALWHGSHDSFGYQHERIVEELCKRLKPDSPLAALKMLYPKVTNLTDATDLVDLDARVIVDRGFLKWTDLEGYARKYWKPTFGSG